MSRPVSFDSVRAFSPIWHGVSVSATGLGWVQALPWNQVPQSVRELPLNQLEPATGAHGGVLTAGVKVSLDGRERLAVLRHSGTFASAQLHSLAGALNKAQRQFKALSGQLDKPGSRYKGAALRKRLDRILAPQCLPKVLTCDLQAMGKGWCLNWQSDPGEPMRLHSTRFVRTVLLTNRLEWKPRQVLDAYAGQERIERVFRGLKEGDWLPWGPMY